ncbi:MAG: Maf family protein [Lachnospiraceae bacterium]|nr:Maf family protein [Lachnospiraceae bacterium]
MKRIILASGSPRRRELLAQTGLEFEVIPGEIDEDGVIKSLSERMGMEGASERSERRQERSGDANRLQSASPCDYPAEVVKALSLSKAKAVAAQIPAGIIIGSDTIVWDHEIMGKPSDRADAYRMLRQLQGRTHSVFTGVTVLVKDEAGTKEHVFFCETKVEVYPMTEQETEAYLNTGEPMDKAGAYGIQGKFGLWVKGIEGDYNSVVGLPLSALWQVLKEYV